MSIQRTRYHAVQGRAMASTVFAVRALLPTPATRANGTAAPRRVGLAATACVNDTDVSLVPAPGKAANGIDRDPKDGPPMQKSQKP